MIQFVLSKSEALFAQAEAVEREVEVARRRADANGWIKPSSHGRFGESCEIDLTGLERPVRSGKQQREAGCQAEPLFQALLRQASAEEL